LFKNCKLLEEADISNCYEITNAGIASPLHEKPTLRSLSFSSHFDPIMLAALVSNSPSLREISLRCKCTDLATVLPFVSPQLKSLCLANSYKLRDAKIKIFVSFYSPICSCLI
jgi:hypothetical protein